MSEHACRRPRARRWCPCGTGPRARGADDRAGGGARLRRDVGVPRRAGRPRGRRSGRPDDEVAGARRAAVREADEEVGLQFPPDALVPFSHWTGGASNGRRFAAWYFLAPAPAGEVTLDEHECTDHRWIRPGDAVDGRDRGEIAVVAPTWMTLHSLLPARHRRRRPRPGRGRRPPVDLPVAGRRGRRPPRRAVGRATPATRRATPPWPGPATGSSWRGAAGRSSRPDRRRPGQPSSSAARRRQRDHVVGRGRGDRHVRAHVVDVERRGHRRRPRRARRAAAGPRRRRRARRPPAARRRPPPPAAPRTTPAGAARAPVRSSVARRWRVRTPRTSSSPTSGHVADRPVQQVERAQRVERQGQRVVLGRPPAVTSAMRARTQSSGPVPERLGHRPELRVHRVAVDDDARRMRPVALELLARRPRGRPRPGTCRTRPGPAAHRR